MDKQTQWISDMFRISADAISKWDLQAAGDGTSVLRFRVSVELDAATVDDFLNRGPKYTVTEWVAKAMYEGDGDGRVWEHIEPNEKPAWWLALAEAAIAKYEEIR